MNAYHNSPELKAETVAQMKEHREADEIVQGRDWGEVFGDIGGVSNPVFYEQVWREVGEDSTLTVANPILRTDVAKILAVQEGEADESSWRVVAQLNDGRFIFAEGNCDYTGWDCQSSVHRFVSRSLDAITKYAMSIPEREWFEKGTVAS